MGGTEEKEEQDFEEMEGLQDEDLDGSDMEHDRSEDENNNDVTGASHGLKFQVRLKDGFAWERSL